MRYILLVHQSAEMYGSDKVLLNLVVGLSQRDFHPIVLVPEPGPLVEQLQMNGIEVHILSVCKVSRATFSLRGILGFPLELFGSLRGISKAVGGRTIALVHSNTLAVVAGVVWAKVNSVPSLWHVHEILLSPKLVSWLFPVLVRALADKVVCNSEATAAWMVSRQPSLNRKAIVLWNGIPDPTPVSAASIAKFRAGLRYEQGTCVFALLGRINKWKGQRLLVEAARLLVDRGVKDFKVLIVGDAFRGQEHLKQELLELIQLHNLSNTITILGFSGDVDTIWNSIDVALVPSTEPEPFGMVAIEAMAAAKPVIAANHGGLVDIVLQNETGLLFEPGSASKLADAMEQLVLHAELREKLGSQGKLRQQSVFTTAAQIQGMEGIYNEI